ncbi:MAG TPA: hypothetical protein VGI95_04075 [Caulobacteraceae bacterium]
MQVIDVNEFRDPPIRLHSLTGVDDAYTFYYDETNNPRRFYVETAAFNVEPLCFVLGGIVHRGDPRPLDLSPLRQAVRLQANAPELKLRHLGGGDFLNLLGSAKVEAYLDWLAAEQLTAHYFALDPLFWAVIDIVDSIISHDGLRHMQRMHTDLKADLYEILAVDQADMADLFARYSFPDVVRERGAAFVREVLERVEAREEILPHFGFQMLKGVLQGGVRAGPLIYLEDETPHALIDSFEGFFLDRLCLFKRAQHVLDVEPVIQARLAGYEFVDGDRPLRHFRFADSKTEAGVQASDPLVGLLGKLFSYAAGRVPSDVVADRRSLSPQQRRTLAKLAELIDRSVEMTPAMAQRVMSNGVVAGSAYFLESS